MITRWAAGGEMLELKFTVTAPDDASVDQSHISTRPNQEQPYYNLTDERFRNLSLSAYPLYGYCAAQFPGGVPIFAATRDLGRINGVEGIGIAARSAVDGAGDFGFRNAE